MAITLDGGINTVLFNLYLLRLGYGPDLVGAVNSVGMGVFAIACIPVGRLCERYSLLPIMRVGMVLIFIGSLFVPLVGWLPPTTHTAVLVMSAIISNLGLAAYFVAGAPYLGALSTIQQRTSIFSIQSATFAVFGFAGSLIGGNLPGALANMGIGDINQPLPYQWTLWLVPIFLLVSLYLVSLMRDVNTNNNTTLLDDDASSADISSTEPSKLNALKEPAQATFLLLAFFGLLRFLQVGGVASMQTFFNVYMDRELHVSTAIIGNIQAFAKLLGVPAAFAIPWFTRKLGSAGTVILALCVAALGMLPMAWIPIWWVAATGYIFVWLTTPARYAAFMVFIMSSTPSSQHGTLNGSQEGLAGLSFAVVALLGGYMIQSLGYSLLFTLSASSMLLGAGLLALYVWRGRRA